MHRQIVVRLALLGACLFLGTEQWRPAAAQAGGAAARAAARTATFDDGAGHLLVNRLLHLICYAGPAAGAPLAHITAVTDAAGQIDGLPANCTHLAALLETYAHPSGKPGRGPAYRIYAASFAPNSPIPVDITSTVHIRSAWPLTLFDVQASLAWDPAPGDGTAAALRGGLYQASKYLYDLTEGQMAIGPVAIHTGGHGWAGADLRVLPSNDYRPSASVGGIVPARLAYTTALPGALGDTAIFAPGAIVLGRAWDGADAFDPALGAWDQPVAWRTLVHEWGHYALFLFDEYQEIDGGPTYCTCSDLPDVTGAGAPGVCGGRSSDVAASVMAYQYTAGEFWHPDPAVHGEPAVCAATAQVRVHGEADWKVLFRWGTLQGLPPALTPIQWPATLAPTGSLGVVGDLFGRSTTHTLYVPTVASSGPPPPATTSAQVHASLDLPGRAALGYSTQAYLLMDAGPDGPARILPQGRLLGDPSPSSGYLGSLQFLGVPPGGRLRLSAERYAPAGVARGRFVYPGPAGPDEPIYDDLPITAQHDAWQASLDASYSAAGGLLTVMTLTLTSESPLLAAAPEAQLCDVAQATGCPTGAWRQTMAPLPGDPTAWQAVFGPLPGEPELPLFGVVHVTAPGVGEIVRWFQVAGGVGPAHIDADAPLRDGPLMVDAGQVLDGACNRVVLMPAADQAALDSPLPTYPNSPPASFEGLVGLAWDVAVLLPGANPGTCAPTPDDQLPVPVSVTLFYSQDLVDQLGLAESQLRLLHYFRANAMWADVTAPGNADADLNWVASVPLTEAGIFAIGWTAP